MTGTRFVSDWFKRLVTVGGTGVSFVIFMVWGFLLGVVLFPVIRIFKGHRARSIFHGQVRLAWRVFIRIMQLTGGFRSIRVEGVHHLPKDKPSLLICNHLTLIDIVVLGAYVRDFNCVVKMGLWNHPFFGSVVKACDFIPNQASEEFLSECKRSFAEKRPLIVFPQGERCPPDAPVTFQRGAAQIAVRVGSGVPIHPVIYRCEPLSLAKGMPWYKVPPMPRLTVTIQPELPIPQNVLDDTVIPLKVRKLTAFWEQYFEQQIHR
ncbi:MAG: 1-acyl-sn-glycerol-3-phosphate acyltransferase [Deltaproteobacteria bacterium]|nr:1-acyl-sn-glycerol-3-phosphate acyltransferase [Deltaproteobacteria bacterium]MBN2673281.1 1-acyl-sn-glycerol-3-phosphate acyltransferase [Deltaproteobacteria bacterium]